jgi:hypothetical protein
VTRPFAAKLATEPKEGVISIFRKEDQMLELSVILIWILIVPILPAWVFQKLIPSQVEISGPLRGLLQGLNLKVVGGIAGYCVLVYLAWSAAADHMDKQWEKERIAQGPKYEEWDVKGKVTLTGPLGNTQHPIIALIPTFTWSPADEKNTFQFFGTVPVKHRDIKNREIGYFKAIVISYENYSPSTVDLKEVKLTKDTSEITLQPVSLTQWKGGVEKESLLKQE